MNDYIKKMAEHAGMEWETQSWCWLANPPHLEKFVELVRADEREACARLCEDLNTTETAYPDWDDGTYDCAKAIRARGQK